MKYEAPKDGWYIVDSKISHSIPTGNNIIVDNPDRKWWQFWKEKTISIPEYKMVESDGGKEVKYLKAGDKVSSTHRIQRLGDTK